MKISKISILLLSLLFLSGCISPLTMNPEKFTQIKKENSDIVIFKVNLNYSGNKIDLYPVSSCHISFTNGKSQLLKTKISKHVDGGNYVFITPKNANEEIYFNNIYCMQYRVFYNKIRFKTFKTKVASIKQTKKINYGGDIDINWTSQGFKFYDLFNLGHMGIEDKGSSSIRGKDRYENYLDFISEKYNTSKADSKNTADKNILESISQEKNH